MLEVDKRKTEEWLKKAEESPRGQRAQQYFQQGYNCAQSVALAFADLIEMDERMLVRMTSSFGGGMGRLREVCGAVSGMFFVAGALYGYETPGAAGQQEKAAHYTRIQALAEEYRAVNGSIVCANCSVSALRTERISQRRSCARQNIIRKGRVQS